MKKSLTALAVLSMFAGASMAANVTMYGAIDTGLQYSNVDDGVNSDVSTFEMNTGANTASRFGLKGTEDLGNGLKLGFVLENGFDSDDGELGNGGRLFGREALVYLDGAWGQLGMGRVGELASGNGTYGLFGSKVSPFSTGWDKVAGHKFVMAGGFDRLDNTVTYKSPNFAGFNVYAQYSFDTNSKDETEREGSAATDRQYAVGATYQAGNLYLAGIVQQTNVKTANLAKDATVPTDDPLTISLGGNYDFGVAKLFVATQYFKDSKLNKEAIQSKTNTGDLTRVSSHNGGYAYDGFGLTVGTAVPVFGGTAKALVGYMSAEDQAKTNAQDFDRYAFSVGYEYPLSKRTFLYSGASYWADSYDKTLAGADDKASTIAVNAGLVHTF